MERQTFLQLVDKYLDGTASHAEQTLLEEYYKRLNQKSSLELNEEEEQALQQAMLKNIQFRLNINENVTTENENPNQRKRTRTLWYSAAASILLFLSIGGYFIINKKSQPQIVQIQTHDVAPGGNKAILKLADGRIIIIDDAKNGLIAQQAFTTINKSDDGSLVYKDQANAKHKPMVYDTLTIPRGGQYPIRLADGTKVWLNSATSIRYPETFAGNERKIELIYGEAYFEVAHNAAKPFRVIVKGQTIEDLGTQFNINSYDDEPAIRTTLLEGSVKVSMSDQKVLLKPGQQAIIKSINSSIIVQNVDIDEAVAWKNGYFKFNGEDLKSVMRKVSRWYNVDITYQGNFGDNISFLGEVSRSKNISAVLKIMEATGNVHFQVAGRRVVVMP
jgi:ferric-dicitrate binding protein FerR (iron transport regulator)